MEKTKLQGELEELHEELGRTRTLDPASRQLLGQLQRDIQAALKQSSPSTHASLVGSLNIAVSQFEDSHPELTKMLKSVLDNLANI